jgi:hypothetical protein
MSDRRSMIESFRGATRAVQWAIIAAVGLALFFVWSEYLDPVVTEIDARAAEIEEHVQQVRSAQQMEAEFKPVKNVVETLGKVQFPGSEAESAAAFHSLVNSVLSKNSAANPTFAFRPKGNLPKNALGAAARNRRVERLTGDLKFDASPEAATSIIAELESSPDVEAINSVRITKIAQGKVQVQLALEAWVLASAGATKS